MRATRDRPRPGRVTLTGACGCPSAGQREPRAVNVRLRLDVFHGLVALHGPSGASVGCPGHESTVGLALPLAKCALHLRAGAPAAWNRWRRPEFRIMTSAPIRFLDLFAVAGGMTAGFHAASSRFQTVRAVEMDLAAAATYEQTFGKGVVYAGSIQDWLATEEVPTDVDIVIGGPPCQGFSTLGKQDVEDGRNSLWTEYAATIVRPQPKYLVVESTAAFAKSQQFRDFTAAVEPGELLEDYAFEFRVLNAADYGAFQSRKRAVLIGHHKDLKSPGFLDGTHNKAAHRTVEEAFAGIPWATESNVLPPNRSVLFASRGFASSFTRDELHLGRDYAPISLARLVAAYGYDSNGCVFAMCWDHATPPSFDVEQNWGLCSHDLLQGKGLALASPAGHRVGCRGNRRGLRDRWTELSRSRFAIHRQVERTRFAGDSVRDTPARGRTAQPSHSGYR